MSRFDLTIDALVVEGLDAADAPVFGHALRVELARLIEERGVPRGLGDAVSVDRLSLGDLRVGNAGPAEVGVQVAGAVYRGLGR